MSEQLPPSVSMGADGGMKPSTVQTQPEPMRERYFNDEVIDAAQRHGWRTFHLRDKDSIHIVRGRGFPDLVMFRKNQATSSIELIVAELKRGHGAEPTEEQEEWLEALGHHIPTTYTWRPENWDEIDAVLQNGTANHSGTWQPAAESESRPIPANFRDVITNITEAIEAKEMTTGEKASLRRMDPSNPDSAVFWKLINQQGMPRNLDVKKWGLITNGIALMAHTAGLAHNPRHPVGQTLYEGNGDRTARAFYSDDRLATLLAARGPTLHRLLGRLFRMLANERCSFNWREMAWFILNEGCNEAEADKARIGIARAYYRAERRHARAVEPDNE